MACFSQMGNIILTGRRETYTLKAIKICLQNWIMIPNRIVRYFMFLGYALGHGGWTSFPTFQNGVIQFYFEYLERHYYLNKPGYYPQRYGVN